MSSQSNSIVSLPSGSESAMSLVDALGTSPALVELGEAVNRHLAFVNNVRMHSLLAPHPPATQEEVEQLRKVKDKIKMENQYLSHLIKVLEQSKVLNNLYLKNCNELAPDGNGWNAEWGGNNGWGE